MKRKILGFLVPLLFAPTVQAQTINPATFTGLISSTVATLVETTAITGMHRPVASATPLGVTLGLEIGGDVALVLFPQAFKDALRIGAGVANAPQFVPVPKISIRKGLPLGIDLGVSGIFYTGISVFGGDVQWAFLKGTGPLPAISVRGGYTYSQLFFLQTHVATVDALISKNLAVFDPYVGGGVQFVSGSIVAPASIAATIPGGLSLSSTSLLGHVFGGFALKLFILKIIAEADYNFNGTIAAAGRVAFSF